VRRALDALENAGCFRMLYLEPRGAPDPAVRALLRGYGEVLCAEASADDVDLPPSRIETFATAVQAGEAVSDIDSARRLLAQSAQAINVVAAAAFRMVTDSEALPPGTGDAQLDPGRSMVLSPGRLGVDGTVLALLPEEANARWLRVE
jgi:hypothetical protein